MSAIVALSIAGSDPSGGAGIQADLKTFGALNVYGTCVITALTAQNTRGVAEVQPVPADFVRRQLDVLLDDVTVHATKIGMVANAEVAGTVADVLRRRRCGPVILDPVMVATSGDQLFDDGAVDVITQQLIPVTDLITPNLAEAAVLLGVEPAGSVAECIEHAEKLRARHDVGVLLKGGHLDGEDSVDVLANRTGTRLITRPRVDTDAVHGTGCTLSSALAAFAARGGGSTPQTWRPIVEDARSYLQQALVDGRDLGVGGGHGPLGHALYRTAPQDAGSET